MFMMELPACNFLSSLISDSIAISTAEKNSMIHIGKYLLRIRMVLILMTQPGYVRTASRLGVLVSQVSYNSIHAPFYQLREA